MARGEKNSCKSIYSCDYYSSRLIPNIQFYLKDSFTLLRDINEIEQLHSTAKLLTIDAVSMYTNIDTNHGLLILSDFIHPYKNSNKLTNNSDEK